MKGLMPFLVKFNIRKFCPLVILKLIFIQGPLRGLMSLFMKKRKEKCCPLVVNFQTTSRYKGIYAIIRQKYIKMSAALQWLAFKLLLKSRYKRTYIFIRQFQPTRRSHVKYSVRSLLGNPCILIHNFSFKFTIIKTKKNQISPQFHKSLINLIDRIHILSAAQSTQK